MHKRKLTFYDRFKLSILLQDYVPVDINCEVIILDLSTESFEDDCQSIEYETEGYVKI